MTLKAFSFKKETEQGSKENPLLAELRVIKEKSETATKVVDIDTKLKQAAKGDQDG